MRIPPWPLLSEPLKESERLSRLRADVDTPSGPPASAWREVCLVWLARLEQSQDPKLRRLADIGFEELWEMTHTVTLDQEQFYDDRLDHMRRLDLPRVRPGAFDIWGAFLRCQQIRRQQEKKSVKPEIAKRQAIDEVAEELGTTRKVFQALLSKWNLDPGSDDMIDVPNRDSRPPAFVDFEVVRRARRQRRLKRSAGQRTRPA